MGCADEGGEHLEAVLLVGAVGVGEHGDLLRDSVAELSRVAAHCGQDILAYHVEHGERLNVYDLAVVLKAHLVTGGEFLKGKYLVGGEEVNILFVKHMRKRVGGGLEV